MEDTHHLPAELGQDYLDSDSLSSLHTAWLDDEQLNQLPILDVFADVSTPKAKQSDANGSNIMDKATNHSTTADSVLNAELEDDDAQLLDDALDLRFDTDLSPILEPFADATEATVAMSPLKMRRRQSKSRRTRRTSSSPLRRMPTATTPRQTIRMETEAPLAVMNRPRTRSSSWQEQEQNTFFTMFKVKWPPTPMDEPVPPFSSLLLQRFDAISTKVRTKSVMEVRQFYTTVMQNISTLLEVVENDIDLTNPDQVRIAVWCWSKLMADKNHYEEFQALDSESSSMKLNLANVLHQSIIRSRRQMLKAKSDNSANSNTAPGLTSISAWVSRSNLSSFFARGNAPISEASSVQIHHPMVRKKHSKAVLTMPTASSESPKVTPLKRKRSASTERFPAADSTKKVCSTEVEAISFTSPTPTDKRSPRNGVAFHTPQQSRKKVYIKMRMVPRNKQTKADVVRCGCRPKVELKLSSTKKISEITAHMSKKWAKVRSVLPQEAVLCFFEKNGTGKWFSEDSNVSCFDIWKQLGKQSKGENVVEVSYLWRVPEKPVDENVHAQDLVPLLAPPGLFEQEVAKSETAQLSPAHSLLEFGQKVAFDRSIADKAKEEAAALEALISDSGGEDLGDEFSPTTGRLRRRIQPMLVSTEEFNI